MPVSECLEILSLKEIDDDSPPISAIEKAMQRAGVHLIAHGNNAGCLAVSCANPQLKEYMRSQGYGAYKDIIKRHHGFRAGKDRAFTVVRFSGRTERALIVELPEGTSL